MLTAIELRRKSAEALDTAEEIRKLAETEKRDLTDDERTAFDEALAQSDTFEADAVRAEKLEARRVNMGSGEGDDENRDITPGRDQIRQVKPEEFGCFGEHLIAIRNQALGVGVVDNRLEETRAILGLNETVSSDGAFLVGTDTTKEIDRIANEVGKIYPLCKNMPIGPGANTFAMNAISETSRATGSRWGGIQMYWVPEAGTITASAPALKRIELKLMKLAGLYYATEESLADAVQLTGIANQGFGEELAFMKDDGVLSGTGAGQMLGIIGHAGTVSVTKETGQTAKTITGDNIIKMFTQFRGTNGVWIANKNTFPQLSTLKVATGTGEQLLWMPANGLAGRPFDTLYNMPLIFVEQCPTLGTVGDICLCDFDRYLTVEKGGIKTASSMHVQFLTDQQVFRIIQRVNGMPIDAATITPYKDASTSAPYSAFVTLATRA